MEKKRLKWKVEGAPAKENAVRGGPMEIRTFIVSFDHSISGKQLP
jgi:alpha-mannosidase